MRVVVCLVALLLASCGEPSSDALSASDLAGETGSSASGTPAGESCVADEVQTPGRRTWRVRKGDSLRRIAQRMYGDENLWKAIRDANRTRVGPEGEIRAGTDLVVPYDGI